MSVGAGAWNRPQAYSKSTCGTFIYGVDEADRQRIRAAAKGLETELRNQGFLDPTTVPDGVFRDKTHEAIKAFQAHVGLKADAQIGPITSRSLFKPVVVWEEAMGRIHIPGHYLHGQIMLESNYDPGAEGTIITEDSGIDRGIVQLNSLSYPALSAKSIYANPRMAISIGANRMRESRRRETDELSYGDQGKWDCAILDHNWPVAADYLFDTGKWLLTDQEKASGIEPDKGRAATYVRLVKNRGAAF